MQFGYVKSEFEDINSQFWWKKSFFIRIGLYNLRFLVYISQLKMSELQDINTIACYKVRMAKLDFIKRKIKFKKKNG